MKHVWLLEIGERQGRGTAGHFGACGLCLCEAFLAFEKGKK